jgi:hypothetical protein
MAGQLTIDSLKASSGVLATQNGMTGIAKAWCYFTMSGTTITIQNSFNISSITRNAAGDFTANLSTASTSANLCGVVGAGLSVNAVAYLVAFPYATGSSPFFQAPTTTTFRFVTSSTVASTGLLDPAFCAVTIFAS